MQYKLSDHKMQLEHIPQSLCHNLTFLNPLKCCIKHVFLFVNK